MATSSQSQRSNMYAQAKTYNPFKGCRYDCTYCIPSFQRQAKRQMHHCLRCYRYEPHEHPERLGKVPGSEIVFVCGNGDISFASPAFLRRIIATITARGPRQTFYLQSKRPACLEPFINELTPNVILVTTLETNRDDGYDRVSKAPPPSVRHAQFVALDWPRKVVTIEPIMDFDLIPFADMISACRPEYCWIGWNSRPGAIQLPEPSREKFVMLVEELTRRGFELRGKDLRGIPLPRCGAGEID